MNKFSLLIFYTFSSSIVISYGIGLDKIIIDSKSKQPFYTKISFYLVNILFIVPIVYLFNTYVLLKPNFIFLTPILIIILNETINFIINFITQKKHLSSKSEKLFILGSIFLSVFESFSFLESIIIAFSCVFSFYFWSFLLFIIEDKSNTDRIHSDWKDTPILFISLGLLSLISYISELSWWFVRF